jgi:hypothetical protein
MFIQLLTTSLLCIVVVVVAQSTVTNSLQGQSPAASILPKQASLDDDYDLNDKTTTAEGSGIAASLDDYVDEEDDDQLSKITATTTSTSTSTTTTTTKRPELKKINESSIKSDDFDANEFPEDYKDDLDDSIDYNEITTKMTNVFLSTTRSSSTVSHRTPLRVFFGFLTRPPIAAGILAGLAIGILTSVILLICIVQRFHKRQRTHSSYTTGLLYSNQYGYTKSPQEFYA